MKSLDSIPTFPIVDNNFQDFEKFDTHEIGNIIEANPLRVNSYSELVDKVSKLAYFNRKYVLFFRGQSKEYRIGGNSPTIFPTFFRKFIDKEMTIDQLTDSLETWQEELKERIYHGKRNFHGSSSMMDSIHMRWALLQHYNKCDTPLIDITQSLHVAASFALKFTSESKQYRTGIIYVFALPWPSKNYHNSKDEEIYLVRLAGITPFQAKRPYRQEAYSVTSIDVDFNQIDNLHRYDLANRLVCKFQIDNSIQFWGQALNPLPETFLVPRNDEFYDFMMVRYSHMSEISLSSNNIGQNKYHK